MKRSGGAPGHQDSPHHRPPAVLESLLLRVVATRPSARFIVGDLREEYAALHRRRGGVLARCWYATEVARLVLRRPGGVPAQTRKRGTSMLESLAHDVRFGARSLRRRPGLSITAGVILALAIGATTAIFSVVDGVLLEPLPFPDPERVVRLGWEWPNGGSSGGALSPLKYEFWQANSESFEALATYRTRLLEIAAADGTSRSVGAMAVSHEFLQVVGTAPILGRDFTAQEDRPGGPRVAILGDVLWREVFGADAGAVGRTVRIGDVAHTVVGVLPADFRLPPLDDATGLLVPLQMEPAPDDRGHNFEVIGRLRPGLDIGSAGRLEDAVTARFAETYPDRMNDGEAIRVIDFLAPYLRTDVRNLLWVLLTAAGAVLLIACANVAGLMLVKTAGRRRELAARTALGASRGCIMRQLLVESLLLAGAATAGGILVAWGTLDVLLAMVPAEIPRLDDVGLDLRVLGATVMMALAVGTLTGTATAFPATREDPATVLREGGRSASEGRGGARLRKALVTIQVALSVAMLSAAAVLLVTVVRLTGADLGFDIDGLYSVRLNPAPDGIASTAAIRALESAAVDMIAGLPGVEAVASAATAPLERGWNLPVTVTAGNEPTGLTVEIRAVSPGYFRTLGTPLVRGRALEDADRAGTAPVAVVNEALAARLPAGAEPLGAPVAVGYLAQAGGWLGPEFERAPHEIVGIAADVREYGAVNAARPTVYVPIEQTVDRLLQIPRILVRSGSPVALAPIRERLLELEPGLRSVDILPMSGARADSIARERFNAVLMGTFGAMALIVTLVGLYGMMADAVGRRVHEIGIRMALGARPGRMLGFVLAQALVTVGAGLALGLAAAVAAGSVLQTMAYEISPTDPRLLGGVVATFVLVTILAGALPARRAIRVEPVEALRADG